MKTFTGVLVCHQFICDFVVFEILFADLLVSFIWVCFWLE